MGVYYSHCLIPRDNTVRPEPDRIVALIAAWMENGFVARSDAARQHEANGGRSETGARFATEASYRSYEETLRQEQAPELQRGLWARLWGGVRNSNSQIPRPDPWMPFSIPPAGTSL